MSDKTLRELQTSLPWTSHYHRDFRASPQTHKDFAHALLHVHKAGGKLAAIIDEAEHGGYDWADPTKRAEVEKFVADMVICALRMATTCPDGQIDLQGAVERRLVAKNNQLAEVAKELRAPPDTSWLFEEHRWQPLYEGSDVERCLVCSVQRRTGGQYRATDLDPWRNIVLPCRIKNPGESVRLK